MSSEEERYQLRLKAEHERWESLCGRCGACCGAFDGDPCEHLKQGDDKKFFCSIYENRFGQKRTIKGNVINCVPIRQILHTRWPGDECCGYPKTA